MPNSLGYRRTPRRISQIVAVLAITAMACSDAPTTPTALPHTPEVPSSPELPTTLSSTKWFTWTESAGIVMLPAPPGAITVWPWSINDKGEVSGTVVLDRGSGSRPAFHAFVWSQSRGFIDLGTTIGDSTNSDGWGIDDQGVLAGTYDKGDERYFFSWTDTSGIKLTQIALARDAHVSIANGVAVLTPLDGFSLSTPARLDIASGVLQRLEMSNERGGDAMAIDDDGNVAGYEGESRNGFGLSSDAVVWDRAGTKTTIFSCAKDSCFAETEAINNHGIAVGSITESNPYKVFRWSRQAGIEFIDLPIGLSQAVIRGIDDEGNIAGVALKRGFVLRPSGVVVDIGSTPDGRGAVPMAMNSHGVIVGIVY